MYTLQGGTSFQILRPACGEVPVGFWADPRPRITTRVMKSGMGSRVRPCQNRPHLATYGDR